MIDQAHSLRKSIEQYMKKKQSKMETETRIIVVASGKGGVGKTNFAVNLAIALKEMGKNVVVFDADLGLANVDVVVGVIPRYNLFDVITKNKTMDDIIITGPSGIKIVPGGSGVESLSELGDAERDEIANKFGKLKDTDIVIVDTGAGINKNVIGFIAVADEVIVITTPEPTAITDAYGLVKVALKYVPKSSFNIVINRALNNRQADFAYEKLGGAIKNFLKKDTNYLGYIIDDAKVSKAVMQQHPFRASYPDCGASRCIDNIASSIMGLSKPVKKAGGIKDFFSKVTYIFGRMQ